MAAEGKRSHEIPRRDTKRDSRWFVFASVYNLAVTKDGTRLLAANKRDQSVSVIELKDGRELARIPTRRSVLHGVVVSPDDRYAFVSVEGVGAEPGTVEIIDLSTRKTVATVDVAAEAAGIGFFRMEPTQNQNRER